MSATREWKVPQEAAEAADHLAGLVAEYFSMSCDSHDQLVGTLMNVEEKATSLLSIVQAQLVTYREIQKTLPF